ncbi:hypothetical protein ANN_23572 [Periplaneta americana]|uniref:Uncharacterized protein n=1 Tax=Periplaneta americana TaxID=6978 RepID=A0ABQ8SNJ1_PERAM|nr:hypothetical protein ANN_23572 [Periplaneta americana]
MLLHKSWAAIKTKTITNCFRKAGFSYGDSGPDDGEEDEEELTTPLLMNGYSTNGLSIVTMTMIPSLMWIFKLSWPRIQRMWVFLVQEWTRVVQQWIRRNKKKMS